MSLDVPYGALRFEFVYVVVCRGPNCRARGAMPLRQRLAKLLRGHPTVRLVGYSCFGQCDCGPNVAFFPPGEWYGGLSAADDAERVVRHSTDAAAMGQMPLELPPAEEAEHRRNVEALIRTLEADRGRRRRWWWPF